VVGEGTYWDETNTSVVAEAVHFALFFTIQEVVVILHADELGPSILLSSKLQLRKLYSPHRTGADVSHFSAPDQIVQRFHCLLKRGIRIEAMDLQQINVVQVEALE
jgi:hypothetical protein